MLERGSSREFECVHYQHEEKKEEKEDYIQRTRNQIIENQDVYETLLSVLLSCLLSMDCLIIP